MNDHEQQKQLLIPETIKVGYQYRSDTYTGRLAYVIYTDHKGELRKAKSWESWRDKKIDVNDYRNEPTNGFVLNRGVGGARRSYGWNSRNEYIRVYDPRGFEFEISIANLLFILRETACSPGKGLEGQFVYAWDGPELVLLPVTSQDYQNCKNFTDLQSKGVHSRDMVEGAFYLTKKEKLLTYVGRFNYYFLVNYRNTWDHSKQQNKLELMSKSDIKGFVKVYVFWNGNEFVYLKDLKSIAIRKDDNISDDFANLVDKYNKSVHGSKPVKLFLKDVPEPKKQVNSEYWYYEESDGVFVQCRTVDISSYFEKQKPKPYTEYFSRFFLKDGVFTNTRIANVWDRGKVKCTDGAIDKSQTPTTLRLYLELENGSKIRVDKEDKRNRNIFHKEF